MSRLGLCSLLRRKWTRSVWWGSTGACPDDEAAGGDRRDYAYECAERHRCRRGFRRRDLRAVRRGRERREGCAGLYRASAVELREVILTNENENARASRL